MIKISLALKKMFYKQYFLIDNFVEFCIPLDDCKQNWDAKSNKMINFLHEIFIFEHCFQR